MSKRQLQGISVSAFAESVGVSYEAVMKRIKKGTLPASVIFEDGSLDEEAARVEWFANTRPHMVRMREKDLPPPPPKNPRQHAEDAEKKRGAFKIKEDREEVELETARFKLEVLKKNYVPVDEAKRAQRAVTRTTRDMFLNFSARYGAELAGEFALDVGAFVGALEAKIRLALNEAASAPPQFDDEDGEGAE